MAGASGRAPSWRPGPSIENLRARARILARIRDFFRARGVLEVETPLLSSAATTDLYLDSIEATVTTSEGPASRYLTTSPELSMKRLLAAGSGDIYQLCKSFRDGEAGRHHNPEFTMLEWYRVGWDHERLMDEVEELLIKVLELGTAPRRASYTELFREHVGCDPLLAHTDELRERLDELAPGQPDKLERDDVLQLLFEHGVEASFEDGVVSTVHSYPASQAALARIGPSGDHDGEDMLVAHRFEAYVGRLELANGFWELTDPLEQRARFEADHEKRGALGKSLPPMDEHFLAALEAGMPDCAGVALGVDRLVMLATGAEHIDEVVSFSARRA